jgi:hypothetical protein
MSSIKQLKTEARKITITDFESGAGEECGCDGIYVSIMLCLCVCRGHIQS